jgi:hypothetical protein
MTQNHSIWLRIEENIGKCSEIGTCSVMGGSTPKPEASPPNTNRTMPIRQQLTPINDNPRTGFLQAFYPSVAILVAVVGVLGIW